HAPTSPRVPASGAAPAALLTTTLSGGPDPSPYTTLSRPGALSFVSAPDAETPADAGGNNVYDVQVQVSDGTNTDTQAIAVTVTNINDNTPVITSNGGGATAAINVAENTTAVTTVTAPDADSGATLTYSILRLPAPPPVSDQLNRRRHTPRAPAQPRALHRRLPR